MTRKCFRIADRRPHPAGVLVMVLALLAGVAAAFPSHAVEVRAPMSAAAPAEAVATDARLAGDDKLTRFVIDLSRKIEMRAFTLADPYRVVIDVPQINFQFPPQTGERGRGVVKAFRYGLVMPGGSRIVIDTTGPVRVARAFVLDPADDQPSRLVMDLTPVDRETFLRAVAVDNRLPRAPEPPRPERDQGPADPRPVVVLDPGHGGIDFGDPCARRRGREDPGARNRHHAARQAGEERQVSGRDDAQR